ncbi:diguanylate cyclase [Halodesulfovibrio aestuarii]|uniref:sensor domain-containing diguanylate cyclase n=1 Tax=Halodesulfovibrio aestuarii TaxID=126333 RepID=UPI003522E054
MEKDSYKEALRTLAGGVYVVDRTRKVLFWNNEAEKLTGYAAEEVLGRCCPENLLHHVDAEGRALCFDGCPLTAAIEEDKFSEASVFMHHKNGQLVPVVLKASPLKDGNGNIIGAVQFFSVVVSRDDFLSDLKKLREIVLQNKLTGIGNREFGENVLDRVRYQAINDNSTYGVLFVGLDDFKDVNERWGYSAGDNVLRMAVDSFLSELREVDTVSHWGGGEFLLILPNISTEELLTIAENIRKLIEKSSLKYEGAIIKVTASLGGVVAEKGEDMHSVLLRAVDQMHVSKDNGRNRVSIDR